MQHSPGTGSPQLLRSPPGLTRSSLPEGSGWAARRLRDQQWENILEKEAQALLSEVESWGWSQLPGGEHLENSSPLRWEQHLLPTGLAWAGPHMERRCSLQQGWQIPFIVGGHTDQWAAAATLVRIPSERSGRSRKGC